MSDQLNQASVDRVIKVAKRIFVTMIRGAGRGSRLHMEKVSTLAKQNAPVLTGNLRASGRAGGPIPEGGEFGGSESGVGFGAGVSAQYAVPVHEKHNPFLRDAESSLRDQAMPLITEEAIKEMKKVKP